MPFLQEGGFIVGERLSEFVVASSGEIVKCDIIVFSKPNCAVEREFAFAFFIFACELTISLFAIVLSSGSKVACDIALCLVSVLTEVFQSCVNCHSHLSFQIYFIIYG